MPETVLSDLSRDEIRALVTDVLDADRLRWKEATRGEGLCRRRYVCEGCGQVTITLGSPLPAGMPCALCGDRLACEMLRPGLDVPNEYRRVSRPLEACERERPCPTCDAERGEQCESLSGKVVPPHRPRR